MKSNTKGSLILILCSLIWGMAFVGQSTAMAHMGPFTFVCLRSVITSVILFAAFPLLNRAAGRGRAREKVDYKAHFVLGGVLGLFLAAAISFQQVGIIYTTAAKSGFVTALYIVIIPILGVFMGRRIGGNVWIGVVVALLGMVLLCLNSDLSVNRGDLYTLVCAFVFSFHVLLVDRYAGKMHSILLSAVQFAVTAIISGIIMLFTETPDAQEILSCWGSVLYVAVFSGAIGYTLQFVGQKYTEPTLASLLMCLESVFSAFGGWLLLGQNLSAREMAGCALMLSASVIAQLPAGTLRRILGKKRAISK